MRLFAAIVLSCACALSGWAQYDGSMRPGPTGPTGAAGAPGAPGPVTNQIVDVNGIHYTITNTPAAGYVLKFDPANSTAWFAAESGGVGDITGWSGAMATQMVFWSVTTVSTNFDAVTQTNLIVSGNSIVDPQFLGSIDPDPSGTFTETAGGYNGYRSWSKNGAGEWIVKTDGSMWQLRDASSFYFWIGPISAEPNGTYPAFDAIVGGPAIIDFSYPGAVITTNTVIWQAGYNASNQAFQIIRNGVVLESWSAPKEPTYPVFRLPMGSSWTDFELKGSTNNFTNLVYFYISSGTNTLSWGDSNCWAFYSDDYGADVRRWNKAAYGASIYSQLASTNSYVDTIYVYPSHDCLVPWQDWMQKTNTNLVWSWVRFDGVDFEKNVDGTKQRWNLIRPDSWDLERTTP